MNHKGLFAPVDISVTQNIRPLSVGTIMYDPAVCKVDGLDFVQVFFPDGTFEFYRIKTEADEIGNYSTRAMEHSIVWLEDYVCTEKLKYKGTLSGLLSKLLSYATATRWRLGNVEYSEEVEIEIDYTNVMQGVMDALDLCEGYGYTFDQTGEVWYINVTQLPEEAECEGRLSRNIMDAVINVDYHDFATRLYVPGKTWHMDSESQVVWGIRENVLNVDTSGVDNEELREQCRKYFRSHSNPSISIQIEAHELGRLTGQAFDWFTPGKMCRLCLMDYKGAVVTERITSRIYPNLITRPELVVLSLANQLPNVSTSINGLSVTMRTIQTELTTRLEATWADLVNLEGELTTQINNVSIRLDSEASRIDAKAETTYVNEAIGVVVTDVGASLDAVNARFDAYVSKDGVITAINLSPGEAKIIAEKIVLDGYVTASQFSALNATITNLTTGLTEATALKASSIMGQTIVATDSLTARLLSADGMNFGGNTVSQRAVTMGNIGTVGKALSTGGELDLQHSHAIVVGENGVLQLGEVSETGGNFNIADTQFFRDAVSAAEEEGRNSVVLEPITINQNGTYTPAEGVDGYNSIVVNVSSSSGAPTLSDATSGGNSLTGLAYALGTTTSNLVRCFSSVQVSTPGYYGFKITAGSNVKYYYFIVE